MDKINILIRVDSSDIIGSGHVYRCLNLAQYYPDHNIEFICKNFNNNLINEIKKKYKVNIISLDKYIISNDTNSWLGEDWQQDCIKTIEIIKNKKKIIDYLIIDHYAINYRWEMLMKPYVKKIMVIDDFIPRKHECNILLNYQIEHNHEYEKCKENTNRECKLLLGKKYLILHPIYKNANLKRKITELKRINIFMGGSDYTNETEKIINICSNFNYDIIYDIVIGKCNKNYLKIRDLCNNLVNFNYYYNPVNFIEILSEADLCIGASGTTMYERCMLNLPTLIIITAENQLTCVEKFINNKCGKLIANIKNGCYKLKMKNEIENLKNNPKKLILMSNNCKNICNLENLNGLSDILSS